MDIRKIKKLIELVEESGSPNWKFLKAKSQYALAVQLRRKFPCDATSLRCTNDAAASQSNAAAPATVPSMEAPAAAESVVTSYVPRWLVLSTAPQARRESVHRSGSESQRGRYPVHVEAMKMMNQIEADKSGTVKAFWSKVDNR